MGKLDKTPQPVREAIAVALMVSGFAMIALYPLPVVRYAIVLIMLAASFAMRGRIVGLVKGLRDRDV